MMLWLELLLLSLCGGLTEVIRLPQLWRFTKRTVAIHYAPVGNLDSKVVFSTLLATAVSTSQHGYHLNLNN